jgi:hypothetical protein
VKHSQIKGASGLGHLKLKARADLNYNFATHCRIK